MKSTPTKKVRRASEIPDFFRLGEEKKRELEGLFDKKLNMEEMARTVALCGGIEVTANRVLTYLKTERDDLGIPKPLWDECEPDQAAEYRRQIAEMDPEKQDSFVSTLVAGYLAGEEGSKAETSPEGRLEAARGECGVTVIGTLLVNEAFLSEFPFPVTASAAA